MKRILRELGELSWTLAGTGLVLITLSGRTRELGIWISLGGLGVHLLGLLGEEK